MGMKAHFMRHSARDASGFQLGQAVMLQDAAVASWKQSLNERPPSPESQDTLPIAATLNRGLPRHSSVVTRQRCDPENAFPG